jgi:transcriptional regulator with XRE-family HTH domain
MCSTHPCHRYSRGHGSGDRNQERFNVLTPCVNNTLAQHLIELNESRTMPTLADLIDDLFRSHRKPNGREYSHVEVCLALGGVIEPSHLGKLRNGTIQNPKRDTLLALCRFFQVSPTYFFPELHGLDASNGPAPAQVDLINALMATIKLPPEAKRHLAAFLRALQTEHLDQDLGCSLEAVTTAIRRGRSRRNACWNRAAFGVR